MSDIPVLRRFLPDYVTEGIRGLSVQSWRNNQLKYVEEQKQKKLRNRFVVLTFPSQCYCAGKKQNGKPDKNTTEFIYFRKMLNDCIPGCGFAVKENATRIQERLQVNLAVKKETCWHAVIG